MHENKKNLSGYVQKQPEPVRIQEKEKSKTFRKTLLYTTQ